MTSRHAQRNPPFRLGAAGWVMLSILFCGQLLWGQVDPGRTEISGGMTADGRPVLLLRDEAGRTASTLTIRLKSAAGSQVPRGRQWQLPLRLEPGTLHTLWLEDLLRADLFHDLALGVQVDSQPEVHVLPWKARLAGVLRVDKGAARPLPEFASASRMRMLWIRPDDLPERPVDSVFGAIVVPLGRVGELSAATLSWLDHYAFVGGLVVLVDDLPDRVLPRLPSPFTACVPANAVLGSGGGAAMELLAGCEITAPELPLRRWDSEMPGAVAMPLRITPHGLGRFHYVSFDALAPRVLSWPGAEALWHRLVWGSPERLFSFPRSCRTAERLLAQRLHEAHAETGLLGSYRGVLGHPAVTFVLATMLVFCLAHLGLCHLYRSRRLSTGRFAAAALLLALLISVVALSAQQFGRSVPFSVNALEVSYLFPEQGRRLDVSALSIRSRFRALLRRRWRSFPALAWQTGRLNAVAVPLSTGTVLDLRLDAFEHTILNSLAIAPLAAGLEGDLALGAEDLSLQGILRNRSPHAILEGVLLYTVLSRDAIGMDAVRMLPLGALGPDSSVDVTHFPCLPAAELDERLRGVTAALAADQAAALPAAAVARGRPVCIFVGLLSTWQPPIELEPGDHLGAGQGLLVQQVPLELTWEPRLPRFDLTLLSPLPDIALPPDNVSSSACIDLELPHPEISEANAAFWLDGAPLTSLHGCAAYLHFDLRWMAREHAETETGSGSALTTPRDAKPGDELPRVKVDLFDMRAWEWVPVWEQTAQTPENMETEALRRVVLAMRASLRDAESASQALEWAPAAIPVRVALADAGRFLPLPLPRVRARLRVESGGAVISNLRLRLAYDREGAGAAAPPDTTMQEQGG